MKIKLISTESFNILKTQGHVVPRDSGNNIVRFRVGREYVVKCKELKEA